MRKIIITIALLLLAIIAVACTVEVIDYSEDYSDDSDSPTNFEECEDAGGVIAESYPRQCFIGDLSFTEIIRNRSPFEIDCFENDGTWVEGTLECEGLSQEVCENLGGKFNECASACRNDPDAEICTMQCVLVCDFGPQVEIPQGCTSWFDGCNTCTVVDGVLGGCTRMACPDDALEEPECLAFE